MNKRFENKFIYSKDSKEKANIKLWIQRNGLNSGQRVKYCVYDKENTNINHSFKMHRTALFAIYAYYFLPFI